MKNIIIPIIVVLGLVAGWYVWQNKSGPEVSNSNNVEESKVMETNQMEKEDNSPKNLLGLLNANKNQMCTYSYTSDDAETMSGTVYIAGDRMRGNYELTGTENYTGSMIKDGDTMYIWASNMPEGIKAEFNPEQMAADIEEKSENSDVPETSSNDMGPVDLTAEVDYDCQSWNVDENVFTVPSDVTFIDTSQMMEQIQEQMNFDTQDACAICDNLSGDAKETCLVQLKCE